MRYYFSLIEDVMMFLAIALGAFLFGFAGEQGPAALIGKAVFFSAVVWVIFSLLIKGSRSV